MPAASFTLGPAISQGWGMLMEYMFSALIGVIWCSKALQNIIPALPYWIAVLFFALLFTTANLHAIRTSARINEALAAFMAVVIVIFFVVVAHYLLLRPAANAGFYLHPLYNPQTFSAQALFSGTSIAVLTYMGFDGVSTLSEEARNPHRDILLATVLVCVITGLLASLEVYAAQLIWPANRAFSPQMVDTAFSYVAGIAGGSVMFHLVNFTLLVANIGSGMGSQAAATRLLYGMGRAGALPRRFFGAIEQRRGIPVHNVLFVGAVAVIGAFAFNYAAGVQLLNFGAFVAFLGVNAAAFMHAFRHDSQNRLLRLLAPVLGFLVCLFLWWNLSAHTKIFGGLCLALAVAYGAYAARHWRHGLLELENEQA